MQKAALVTGGSDRIGREIALTLAEMGYDIALHYNSSLIKAEETAELIKKQNVNCTIFKADFNDKQEVISMFEEITKHYSINILINNASIFGESSIRDNDLNSFGKFYNINFKAPYLLTKLFANKAKEGLIINLLDAKSSKNKTLNFDYLLTKKALSDFTEMCAVDLAPEIRVNAIAPGIILVPAGKDEEYILKLALKTPMKRIGTLQDIKESVKYLVLNEFITGQTLYIDGGLHL